MPTAKVGSAALAGALTIILMWVLSLVHVDVPAPVASAITTAISFATSWLVPNSQ